MLRVTIVARTKDETLQRDPGMTKGRFLSSATEKA
jgi:hypothetical protein